MSKKEALRINWAKHKDKYNARRKEKRRKAQDAVLVNMITEYVEGATLKSLCEKYKVVRRKENDVKGE